MSQTYTSALWEGSPDLPRRPLSLEGLDRLYAAADWGVVLRHAEALNAYGATTGRLSPLAMFRALALPYLIHIESEASLARELAERDALRALCGFWLQAPTRSKFWHFRHTPQGFYPDVMLKVLVALGLAAETLHLPLPCVRSMQDHWAEPAGKHFTFQLSPYGPEIDMWTTPGDRFPGALDTVGKPVGQLYRELRTAERLGTRPGMAGQLELPAEVAVGLTDREPIRFAIHRPDWLKPGSGDRSRSSDTITTLGSARSSSYAACNIIVLRQDEHGEQVLLTRRLVGTWKGQYALPGGKAKPEESLETCAKRELFEETGLKLARSSPISIHLVKLPGHARVFSVGAVVTEYSGELRRREPQQNEDWLWFNLDDLPAELSLPAQLALSEYRKGRLQGLDWSKVDIQWSRSGRSPHQLTLDSALGSGRDEVGD